MTAEPGFFQKLFKKVDPNPVIASVVSALEKMMADRSSLFVDPVWDRQSHRLGPIGSASMAPPLALLR